MTRTFRRLKAISLSLLLLSLPLAAGANKALPGTADARPRVAVIIDDLGYEFAAGRRVVRLPGPVACAVLPATPRGKQLAELAARNGKEVLLHLPLQAQNYAGDREPGAILLDMTRQQFAATFAANLASIPHVIGVNNHRGSLLTRHPGHMSWLMEELRARGGLFFVDSYTTHRSVAMQVAQEAGVPAVRRDVFLDAERSAAGVAREFERLLSLARKHGSAIAIGHPYPETLDFLEQALPGLAAQGIDLVSLGELLPNGY
ncbi:divergent polysaccharide deacetylase family protein [Woeseia oceani]|uniref:Divergent polysaccharide deacetylase family protein n=1 Tax=Woeseia oceani TaxID=1548547 RepID=A0A193LJX7_9GAMM|nr:divergent polysaccharide deacetylase family protein [Woeseia oceani]ANO52850.1 hypothetical protein BA177_18135 [Woeseia oceani]